MAKKESEKQNRHEQNLKRKEDEDLKMALAVSKLQVSNDKPLVIPEQKAKGKGKRLERSSDQRSDGSLI